MDKNELNKQWAELEGWKPAKVGPTIYETKYPEDGYLTPDGMVYVNIPDFTEPNRFFAEVVPRMYGLGFKYADCSWYGAENFKRHVFMFYLPDEKPTTIQVNDKGNPCMAGLEAAIKARKEIGK